MRRITTGLAAACAGLAIMLTALPAQGQLGLSRVEFFALQQEMRDRGCGNQTAGGALNAETQRALRVCAERLGVAATGTAVLHAMNIGFSPNDNFAAMQARRNELASAPTMVRTTTMTRTTTPVSTTTTTTYTAPTATSPPAQTMPTARSDPPRAADMPRAIVAPSSDRPATGAPTTQGGATSTPPQ